MGTLKESLHHHWVQQKLAPTSTLWLIGLRPLAGSTEIIYKSTLQTDKIIFSTFLNPKVDIPLFATNANPLQLYHSPR